MKTKINKLLAILMFCLSIAFFISALTLSNTSNVEARDNNCHAKNCELDKISCVCCLRTSGSIACSPCGSSDCQ
jgi:preprotein translocase subunit SecG